MNTEQQTTQDKQQRITQLRKQYITGIYECPKLQRERER
jgi:hypothetical protein